MDEQIADLHRRVRHDMEIIFATWGLDHCLGDPYQVLDELVDCAMFQIERLVDTA